jgi:DNA polymerase elongation subunit (family B)
MLDAFLSLIEDSDVLSGWNSEGFDIPYLVNRIMRVLGEEELRRFCLWGMMPRAKEQIKFGRAFTTYEMVGRVHLDYLVLYQKHNTQQRHSYSLDAIGEIEVNERKTPYDGTLDALYNKDFYRFIEYSRQDVALLVKIDAKVKFIGLANQIAHANGVLLQTTVGSVALVEQAIINEMNALGFVVPDRPEKIIREDGEERVPVVGAYVAPPETGIHYEVACVDINSLYPSAIRALNMSPETLWGQIRTHKTMELVEKRAQVKKELAWEGLFSVLEVMHMHAEERHEVDLGCGTPYAMVTVDPDTPLVIDTTNGQTMQCTAAELKAHIWANDLCVSANGTIFQTDRDGIIPQLLAKWYSERKEMQGKQKAFDELTDGLEIDDALASELADMVG